MTSSGWEHRNCASVPVTLANHHVCKITYALLLRPCASDASAAAAALFYDWSWCYGVQCHRCTFACLPVPHYWLSLCLTSTDSSTAAQQHSSTAALGGGMSCRTILRHQEFMKRCRWKHCHLSSGGMHAIHPGILNMDFTPPYSYVYAAKSSFSDAMIVHMRWCAIDIGLSLPISPSLEAW